MDAKRSMSIQQDKYYLKHICKVTALCVILDITNMYIEHQTDLC